MEKLEDLKFTDLRGTKVYVDCVEHSVLLQKMLFAMGGMWADGTTGLDNGFDEPRMYVISEDLLFCYSKHYNPSRNKEVFMSDILGNDSSCNEYSSSLVKGAIVLARHSLNHEWVIDRFIQHDNGLFHCHSGSYKFCVIYRGNGRLLGTKIPF